jgi:hypothetical protein
LPASNPRASPSSPVLIDWASITAADGPGSRPAPIRTRRRSSSLADRPRDEVPLRVPGPGQQDRSPQGGQLPGVALHRQVHDRPGHRPWHRRPGRLRGEGQARRPGAVGAEVLRREAAHGAQGRAARVRAGRERQRLDPDAAARPATPGVGFLRPGPEVELLQLRGAGRHRRR